LVPRSDIAGLALDWKLPTRTFLGVQAQFIQSRVDQSVGVFRSDGSFPPRPRAVPSSTAEELQYEERSVGVWASQLFGAEWSLGASYRLTDSRLNWFYPEIPSDLPLNPNRDEQALLQVFEARLPYQHAGGFFARADARWFIQHNRGYGVSTYSTERPDDSTTQLDFIVGYRFPRRRAVITVGLLNALGEDYRFSSLTPYPDLPREHVFLGRVRFHF
jgi:outer membrane receptor protein involved in Fe transport